MCGGIYSREMYYRMWVGSHACRMQVQGMYHVGMPSCMQHARDALADPSWCPAQGQALTLELGISDTTGTRRRVLFSSSFAEVKATPLHCQVGNAWAGCGKCGQWVTSDRHMAL